MTVKSNNGNNSTKLLGSASVSARRFFGSRSWRSSFLVRLSFTRSRPASVFLSSRMTVPISWSRTRIPTSTSSRPRPALFRIFSVSVVVSPAPLHLYSPAIFSVEISFALAFSFPTVVVGTGSDGSSPIVHRAVRVFTRTILASFCFALFVIFLKWKIFTSNWVLSSHF